ncbi:26S proteasome non-ATPase regulatory subunit 6 [Lepeophtheirus salmonis]|uniref:26S proteasome non-ATPase regulatory subunit 6 n=1 Tax=Lepeophtheirus salmonis TaxID=72036 RepID=C1BTF4_LEPSM|nr:26S proteasome non-ATPase regulatory subunit 6-like [Lepeophtheirus salmonis]ACO12307.1 26S proteasome non-ATPase regulatory subunit 6 [Lepeophtheirus salmonis]ADD24120.1 26S proteasome non-ATPase regulatory subunit 6 [Lepeophtheirus salmonis]
MPSPTSIAQGLQRIPDLQLAQSLFMLKEKPSKGVDYGKMKEDLMESIKKNDMCPFYRHVLKELEWKEDAALVKELTAKNEAVLKEMEEKIKDAEVNLGESETREALLAQAEYLTKIGDKDRALEAIRKTMEKTVGLGNRMDLIFHNIRLGLFFMDHPLIKANIEKASSMLEEGGDWDRRNRLKVYEGLYAMGVRDFKKAAGLFLETISTFTSYELMDYVQFVHYTVYSSVIALDRGDLHNKVIKGSEILEVLHDWPEVKKYLFSLYDCHYGEFFQRLASVEKILKADRYLYRHYAFYVREMKIKAFAQLLESYRSLTLSYMAESFGVTEDYMDKELARFIADGRLHCRIDKVRGIVITNRPDSKNSQYQSTIKQGDILLNRVQKLSRVINI